MKKYFLSLIALAMGAGLLAQPLLAATAPVTTYSPNIHKSARRLDQPSASVAVVMTGPPNAIPKA